MRGTFSAVQPQRRQRWGRHSNCLWILWQSKTLRQFVPRLNKILHSTTGFLTPNRVAYFEGSHAFSVLKGVAERHRVLWTGPTYRMIYSVISV